MICCRTKVVTTFHRPSMKKMVVGLVRHMFFFVTRFLISDDNGHLLSQVGKCCATTFFVTICDKKNCDFVEDRRDRRKTDSLTLKNDCSCVPSSCSFASQSVLEYFTRLSL